MICKRQAGLAAALALLAALAACDAKPTTPRASGERAPSLWSLDYDFVVHSKGIARSPQTLALASTAHGRLTLVSLDEPPLLVGSIAVDHMGLRSAGQALADLSPGEWSFLARRTANGTVDAVWLDADMPSEAGSLTRFLVAQLQTPAQGVTLTEEQTPAGAVQARYHHFDGPLLRMGVRERSAPGGAQDLLHGATLFIADGLGLLLLASVQVSREAHGDDEIASVSVLLALRGSETRLPDSASTTLREQIEGLSATPPMPLVELPLSEQEKDAMRRDAESWESVKKRLAIVGDVADPTLVGRAAAHLATEEALARELQALAVDPSTPLSAASAMYMALGDCGTKPCQDLLIEGLVSGGQVRPEVLAAVTRVSEPTTEMIDRLLEIGDTGDEVGRAAAGVVLSRFAQVDPVGAAARVERILDGIEGCSAQLDGWFGLLGNAGLLEAKPILLACIGDGVPTARRASAAGAMRRIPGADVTQTLVRLAAEDPNPAVRLGCLRALVSRELRDADLAPLVGVTASDWRVPAQSSLIDVVEGVVRPGTSASSLLEGLTRSEHEEVAARARQANEVLFE